VLSEPTPQHNFFLSSSPQQLPPSNICASFAQNFVLFAVKNKPQRTPRGNRKAHKENPAPQLFSATTPASLRYGLARENELP